VEELIFWLAKLNTNKKAHYPIKQETKTCRFTMHTRKYLEINLPEDVARFKI